MRENAAYWGYETVQLLFNRISDGGEVELLPHLSAVRQPSCDLR